MAARLVTGVRAFFYVQHLLGVGHLARASRIAGALAAQGFAVTLATGGMPVPGFPPAEIATVALPPVRAGDEGFSALVDEAGRPVDEAFKAARRDRLLQAYRAARPDVVLIEAFPFGRRQMRFELLPLLEAIAADPRRPLTATSLRDIQQENRKPGRAEEILDLVERHFDLILVHGDPRFARLEETFPLAAGLGAKVRYTGLVAGGPMPEPGERFDVVVSAGGGAAGAGLVRAAAGAFRLMDPDLSALIVTGPNLAAEERSALERLTPTHVRVAGFRKDFRALLAGAGLSVSQAGYNTVCDLLQAGCRSLLVPFASGGETEQTSRAERLAALGLAATMTEDGLSPERLAEAMAAALARPRPGPAALDLDGARRTGERIAEALGRRA